MRWYYGWNVLATGMVFQAATFGLTFYCFTFWVTPWMVAFGASRAEVMTVFLVLQVTMGMLSPLAGRAMDSASIRGLVIAGAFAFSGALVLVSFASSLWQVGLAYATLQVAGVLLAGPLATQTLAAKWFNRRRGVAIGVVTIGTSIGGFLMPLLVTTLMLDYSWRETHQMLAVLILVAIVPIVWVVVRNTPADRGVACEPGSAPDATLPEVVERIWTVGEALSERTFWILVTAFVPMAMAFGAAQQNFAPYTLDHGIDAIRTSYLVSTTAVMMVIAKLAFGALSDWVDPRLLYGGAIAALLSALALMTGSQTYPGLIVISVLLGIAAGSFLPLMGIIVSRHFGAPSFGRVMGLLGPFTTLGAIGPWIAGAIRDAQGNYDLAWQMLFALVIPAAVTMVWMKLRPRLA